MYPIKVSFFFWTLPRDELIVERTFDRFVEANISTLLLYHN